MLRVAAEGQRELCRGQGAELAWARAARVRSSSLEVIDIFRKKTAPAFEVALQLGAIYAGIEAHDEVAEVLAAYSEALGIAYQIRDDLRISAPRAKPTTSPASARACSSPSPPSAPRDEQKARLEAHWRRTGAVHVW